MRTIRRYAQKRAVTCSLFLSLTGLFLLRPAYCADVQVLTQHNDNQRRGANLLETVLSPASVGSSAFDRLGHYLVDGQVFAQPLFTTIDGQHRLYVATAHNLVYAFDADQPDSDPIWRFDAGSSISATASHLYPGRGPDIKPEVGIIGTPVIDLAHFTIYFVAMTQPDRQSDLFFHTLHAVDIRNGVERGRQVITGNIEGGGIFNSARQNQRAALTLVGNRIYIAWASFGDIQPFDGLVMSYDTADSPTPLAKHDQFQVARFNPVVGTRHKGGGIWQSGGGPAVDEAGQFIYIVTGNGDSNDSHAGSDFDSSDVKLDLSLRVIDYFTPSFRQFLNDNDLDLAVSGPMIPPEMPGANGAPVRRVLHGSKQGILYNLNSDNMGHFHSDSNPVQQVSVFDHEPNPGGTMPKRHIHTTPVFWQTGFDRRAFVASDWGLGIRAFRFTPDGNLDGNPVGISPRDANRFAISQLSVSANGDHDGIVWAMGCVTCVTDDPPDTKAMDKPGVLLAYDATTLGDPIYTSPPLGIYPRFTAPTIANGRVYAPTFSGEVVVFGLKNTSPHSFISSSHGGQFFQSNWGTQGNFEFFDPVASAFREYFRDNDNSAFPWHFLRQIGFPTTSGEIGPTPRAGSFLQSNTKGDGAHGNFAAVVRVAPAIASQPDFLDFWSLDSRTSKWTGAPLVAGGTAVTGITGNPVMIQSNWGAQGNFELLVPQGNMVKQFARDNDNSPFPWIFLRQFGYPAFHSQLGPAPRSLTFIQSNFKGDGTHGNFEVIVRVAPPIATDPDRLDFWYLDSLTLKWNGPFPVLPDGKPIDGITGDPVMFQSNWGTQGNFELFVPAGSVIKQYFRNNDDPTFSWHFVRQFGYRAPPNQIGPTPRSIECFQSNFKGDGVHGNFEAIVRVAPAIASEPDRLDFWVFDSRTATWDGPFPLSADAQPIP